MDSNPRPDSDYDDPDQSIIPVLTTFLLFVLLAAIIAKIILG